MGICNGNIENIRPEWFLRPPTNKYEQDFRYQVRDLEKTLKKMDEDTAPNKLLMGTELEVLFFSADMEPSEGVNKRRWTNPNYGEKHKQKVERVRKMADRLSHSKYFYSNTPMGNLGVELRTIHGNTNQFFGAIDTIRDEIPKLCKQLGILAVAYSQHIHVSMFDREEANFLHEELLEGFGFETRMKKAFSTVLPLVLLPEEYKNKRSARPYRSNGNGNANDPVRVEVRALSSEYACDPDMNLLISLWAINYAITRDFNYFPKRQVADTYPQAIEVMEKSGLARDLFGTSTLKDLSCIAWSYLALSQGETTIGKIKGVKEEAKETEVRFRLANWLNKLAWWRKNE